MPLMMAAAGEVAATAAMSPSDAEADVMRMLNDREASERT
jgi:hypothetical protein